MKTANYLSKILIVFLIGLTTNISAISGAETEIYSSPESIEEAILAASPAMSTINDIGVFVILKPISEVCDVRSDVIVTVRNYGTNVITSFDAHFDIDGGSPTTQNWTGTLNPGSMTTVDFGNFPVPAGTHVLKSYTTNPNGTVDGNATNDTKLKNFTAYDSFVNVNIITDQWGAETTWEIRDGLANVVASGGPYASQGAPGEYPQTLVRVCLQSNECYDMVVNDATGDGMCCTYGNGLWEVLDHASNVLVSGGTFGSQEIANFCPPPAFVTNIFYSVAPGNVSDAIWSTTPTGPGQPLALDCAKSIVIQNGADVVNDMGNITVGSITIDSDASMDLGVSNEIKMCNDLQVNGNLISNGSKITLRGSQVHHIGGVDLTIEHLELNDNKGAKLTSDISISGSMELARGDFDTQSHAVTFISNSITTGRLLEPGMNSNFIGNMIAQNYIGSTIQGWRMMGLSTTNSDYEQWNDDIYTAGFAGSDDPAYAYSNIYDYDETLIGTAAHIDSGFFKPASTTDLIPDGAGRFVYLLSGPITMDVEGLPVQGDVDYPVTYTNSATDPFNDGWNLVANSYQCAVDWTNPSGWTRTNIDPTYYAWDNDLQQWAAYTNGGVGVNGGSRYIAPQQGFWIKSNGNNPQFGYKEKAKVNEHVAYIRESEEFYPEVIKFTLSGGAWMDEMAIVQHGGATDGFDADHDAYKMSNQSTSSVTLYSSITEGDNVKDLTINAYPEFTEGLVIPIHVKVPLTGTYNISANDFNSEMFGACLMLNDLVTSESIVLEPGMDYSFSINASDDSHRFNLVTAYSVSVDTQNVSCPGEFNGEASVYTSGSGAYTCTIFDQGGNTVQVNTGIEGSVTIAGLPAGTYTAEILDDASLCGTVIQSFEIAQPEVSEMEVVTAMPASCDESNNGYISLTFTTEPWNVTLYDENNVIVETALVENGIYEFSELYAGAYQVIAESSCSSVTKHIDLFDAGAVEADFTGPTMINFEIETVTFTNNSDNALSYVWDMGDGTILTTQDVIEYSYAAAGEYNVTLSASSTRCTATYTQSITVEGSAVSVEEIENIGINAYYGENALHVNLDLEQMAEIAVIQVFNSQGKLVVNKSYNSVQYEQLVIALSEFSAGFYTANVTIGNNQPQVFKLIKE